jgi:hypothetical protein
MSLGIFARLQSARSNGLGNDQPSVLQRLDTIAIPRSACRFDDIIAGTNRLGSFNISP